MLRAGKLQDLTGRVVPHVTAAYWARTTEPINNESEYICDNMEQIINSSDIHSLIKSNLLKWMRLML